MFGLGEMLPGTFVPLLRLDKIITIAQLSSSNSEASRKLKERAVRINGDVIVVNQIATPVPKQFALNVGRKWRTIHIIK